jgi:hypothetical protein
MGRLGCNLHKGRHNAKSTKRADNVSRQIEVGANPLGDGHICDLRFERAVSLTQEIGSDAMLRISTAHFTSIVQFSAYEPTGQTKNGRGFR